MKCNARWYICALLLGTSVPAFAWPNIKFKLKQTETTFNGNIMAASAAATQHGIYQLLLHGFSPNYKNMLKLQTLFLLSRIIVGFTNTLCHELGHAMANALVGHNTSVVIKYNLIGGILGSYSGATKAYSFNVSSV